MSRPSSSRGRSGGVGLQSRPNDVYTLMLVLAAVFLMIGAALLAIEQFTFYGELFPAKEGKGDAAVPPATPAFQTPVWASLQRPAPADTSSECAEARISSG